MLRNKDVVNKFINKEPAQGSNLVSLGDRLFSYNTCIAQWRGRDLIINNTKYSRSTSKHQMYLRGEAVGAYDKGKIRELRSVIDIEINTKNL